MFRLVPMFGSNNKAPKHIYKRRKVRSRPGTSYVYLFVGVRIVITKFDLI